MTVPGVSAAAFTRAVEALRGMAYEHRLHILVLLRAGEATPTELSGTVPVHATVVSHHLRHLLHAGLVRRRRRGRRTVYSLAGEATERLVDEVLRYMTGAAAGTRSDMRDDA